MRGAVVIVDGTVAPGLEVSMGPGQGRKCAYRGCSRMLGWDAPPTKRYCASRCRTADWKARRASGTAVGTVTLLPAVGDGENGSARARELREQRRAGPVASDRRVQVSRATECVARMLVEHGLVPSEEAARFYAGIAVREALPARFRA